MAAPQIPNLLSMRGGATGGRGGRSSRGGRAIPAGLTRAPDTPEQREDRKDRLVQATDNDASISRVSAVNAGYLEDPYAREFVVGFTPKRFPIINRGTYVRTTALDNLIEAFIRSNPERPKQIVSLGAGTDTRFWRLRGKDLTKQLLYHEIDFPVISEQKLTMIRSSRLLSPVGSSFAVLHDQDVNEDPQSNRWGFFKDISHTEGFLFHPIDLRKEGWIINNLLHDTPTLLISECCLCYMTTEQANNVIHEFSRQLPTLGIVIYEPTKPDDDFGKVMFQNLATRGLRMPTMMDFPTFDSQMDRLRNLGFGRGQNGADVEWLWNKWVENIERDRINKLEMVDEVEEWQLLARHYVVVWGWKELPWEKGAFRFWEEGCQGILELEPIKRSLDDDPSGPEDHIFDEDNEMDGDDKGEDDGDLATPRP